MSSLTPLEKFCGSVCLLLFLIRDLAFIKFLKGPTEGSESQAAGPLVALAKLSAVVRGAGFGSRQVLGRRLGGWPALTGRRM